MKKGKTVGKLFVALLLALVLMVQPVAFAAETQQPDRWAVSELLEAEALEFLNESHISVIQNPVTLEEMQKLSSQISDKLALLGLPKRETATQATVTEENTRGNLAAMFYNAVAVWELPVGQFDPTLTPQEYMTEKQVIRGYDAGELGMDRVCTLQEAMVIAQRLVAAIYDEQGVASKGLLWKATNGDNTLYLLGTVHVDRGNVYPFSQQLKSVISSAKEVIFELDFNDQEGLQYFTQAQLYSDGTTLEDHVPAELVDAVVDALVPLGMTREQIIQYKAWALANTFTSLSASGGSEENPPMVIDSYVYSKALVEGKKISEVEGYVYQSDMFNSLSEEYQVGYLAGGLQTYLTAQDPEAQENPELDGIDEMLKVWKTRDAEGFDQLYGKDAMLETDDELMKLLFDERDAHMTEKAVGYLNAQDAGIRLLAVGAGHMVGKTGIVSRLQALGYQVELVK